MDNWRMLMNLKNPEVFKTKILDGIAAHLRTTLQHARPIIKQKVGAYVAQTLRGCPEYDAVSDGFLKAHFGLRNMGRAVMETVIKRISDGCVVTSLGAQRVGVTIEGGMRVELIRSDFSEVLGVASGSYTNRNGFTIPWLEWLTIAGDKILIFDHRFKAGPYKNSRSGMGIMLPKGTWRVPPEYSGSPNNNWITRAIYPNAQTALLNIITTTISGAL